MFGKGIHSPEDRRFAGLAAAVVDDLLARDPARATRVGDHRFDDRLPDPSGDGTDEYARVLQRHATFLGSVDARALSRVAAADLAVLRSGVAARLFDMTKIRPHLWNPLVWNPSEALYTLISREFAPAPERAQSLISRLNGVPELLENSRHTLGAMPAVHVDTAIARFGAIAPMLAEMPADVAEVPGVADAVAGAITAIDDQIDWLRSQLSTARLSPALGPELYAGVLQYHLDSAPDPDVLLADAEDSLEEVLDGLASASAKYLRGSMADRSVIPKALNRLDRDDAISGDILELSEQALEAASEFVAERDLVTIPDIDIRIDFMPAVRRGVFPIHCNAPGPMEQVPLPTILGVAPRPGDSATVAYAWHHREYSRQLVHNLMAHVGVPGHALQQARAREATAPSVARAALPSGLFVEGWAVYAEELMAQNGFTVPGEEQSALQIQQLRMRLRSIISTILDVRVHTRGMTEAEGRRLLATRGFLSDVEIPGTWRRAQTTYGRLSAYFLGHRQVTNIIEAVAQKQRMWGMRQVHDAVLAHGSVPPRVLPSLVGLE